MICYFNKHETDFTHNGLGVIDNYIINPVVCEEVNGIFSLEFDYPLTAPRADELMQERIIRCPVPGMDSQLFRISEREAGLGGIFHIVAYHVFYDLVQNLIEDTFVVNRNGQGAVSQILGAAQFPHPFTGDSDISAINSARLVRRNIVEAFLNGELGNSFLSRWGGEILRDNFHITMRRIRGSDNGVLIRDKKNLTGYRSNVDFGTVVTRIMPQGFDGLFLPEKYIDSPLIGNYLTPRIRVIKVKQFSVWHTTGLYPTYNSIIPYLNGLNIESVNFTENVIANSYTGQGDMLIAHRILLAGNPVPKVIHWLGRKDVSDNAVFLFTGGTWVMLGMVTESGSNIIHEWVLSESQRNGITSGNIHIAFFAIKQGSWAGIYNETTTPYTLNPQSSMKGEVEQISTVTSSAAVTVPATATKMRVRISTESLPHEFMGNIYPAEERKDYSQAVYSAILHQNNLINLRVAEDGIINQINLSTEGILIAGNKVHIKGQTTIDNAVISTAMIADAAITNAKIATLDAGKINTGRRLLL